MENKALTQANTNEVSLEYYKQNAEEDYMTTPISVLRYISELEKVATTYADRQWVEEIKLDTILIAKDECKMSDGSGNALVVGKEYSISFIESKDEEFAVSSNSFPNHYFSTNKKHDSYWKRFFYVKQPLPPAPQK